MKQQMVMEQLDIHMQRNKPRQGSNTFHKKLTQNDSSKRKTQKYNTRRRKHWSKSM